MKPKASKPSLNLIYWSIGEKGYSDKFKNLWAESDLALADRKVMLITAAIGYYLHRCCEAYGASKDDNPFISYNYGNISTGLNHQTGYNANHIRHMSLDEMYVYICEFNDVVNMRRILSYKRPNAATDRLGTSIYNRVASHVLPVESHRNFTSDVVRNLTLILCSLDQTVHNILRADQ